MTEWKKQGLQDNPPRPSFLAYIGIGSNMGDRLHYCQQAVRDLATPETTVTKVSSLYETEPVDYINQAPFYNAVVEVRTPYDPLALLKQCQEIEKRYSKNITIPKGPRTLDLDILFYSHCTLGHPDLTLPHPEALKRRFVLVPMVEIAPDFIPPISPHNGLKIAPRITEILQALLSPQAILKVCGPEWGQIAERF